MKRRLDGEDLEFTNTVLLPPVLSRLLTAFGENPDSVSIETDKFHYENISEIIENAEDKNIKNINISTKNAIFIIDSRRIKIIPKTHLTNTESIIQNVHAILYENKRYEWLPTSLKRFSDATSKIKWFFSFIVSTIIAALWILFASEFNIQDISFVQVLFAIFFSVFIVSFTFDILIDLYFKKNSVLIHLSSNSLPESFFKRKKDDLLINAVSLIIGFLLGKLFG